MVKISGTLTSNVAMSGRMLGRQLPQFHGEVKPVEQAAKPVAIRDEKPDMTFSGIGRKLDINV